MAMFTDVNPGPSFLSRVGSFFTSIPALFADITEANSKLDEVKALQSKSDVELAEMGLTREKIVAHVFRDKYYV